MEGGARRGIEGGLWLGPEFMFPFVFFCFSFKLAGMEGGELERFEARADDEWVADSGRPPGWGCP